MVREAEISRLKCILGSLLENWEARLSFRPKIDGLSNQKKTDKKKAAACI